MAWPHENTFSQGESSGTSPKGGNQAETHAPIEQPTKNENMPPVAAKPQLTKE